ncbi:winged helix-turn-helix transcriptional regulator [Paracoccus sp. S-4012]|uniref:Lrp/AsnC family transcriptional regulator n=1 Tax=Paracoccus sp. S-4012 TaxID=2665648 RepID=UPI0012AF9034|nr:Lrp/AsnC family transcriptional regulator [Paracoccus sp. S-4012]MRX50459.1 winged helix-turn-helix transcriptional regulator [Paracoccus sp. S-4012]
MQTLDRIDQALIRALRRDARITNAALAEEVGLSPSACLRRVRLLEERGIIRGYTAIVAGPAQERRDTVIVRITLDRQTEDVLTRFENELRRHPEIREGWLMTGQEDYLLRLEIDGTGDYERVHKDVLSRLPGVARINSSFAIRSLL